MSPCLRAHHPQVVRRGTLDGQLDARRRETGVAGLSSSRPRADRRPRGEAALMSRDGVEHAGAVLGSPLEGAAADFFSAISDMQALPTGVDAREATAIVLCA